MGHGSRKSKNAGTMGSEAMTYAERRALGYGTAYERLGKESMCNFDDCRLTLRPAVHPVCTSQGIIYSKEFILDYLLYERKEIKKKNLAKDELLLKKNAELNEFLTIKNQVKMVEFEQLNHLAINPNKTKETKNKILQEMTMIKDQIHVIGGLNVKTNHERLNKMKKATTFGSENWTSESGLITRRLKDTHNLYNTCPITGENLKFNDLINLKFTKVPQDTESRVEGRRFIIEYMDPVTKDIFTNRSRLVCLRPTGDVMLYETYKNFVEPDGTYDGYMIHKKDVIELQKGGTGFVDHDGDMVIASKYSPLGPGSGMTDLRGQYSGAGANSSLVLL